MKISEAITNLECLEQSQEAGLEDDEKEAIKLGVEALRRLWEWRKQNLFVAQALLPGETEEERE
jgi:hypothetical protein